MADGGQQKVFNIRVKGTDLVAPCSETQKVLLAVEAAVPFPKPKPVRVGCRQGGCGACRIRILSGDYTAIKMSRAHVSQEEQEQGYALACRIYPASDMEIEPAFVSPQERIEMRASKEN